MSRNTLLLRFFSEFFLEFPENGSSSSLVLGDGHFSRPLLERFEVVHVSLEPRVATAFAWGADVVHSFWDEEI